MTFGEAGDTFTKWMDGWLGKLVTSSLIAITGTFAWEVWQTVQLTHDEVAKNGQAEARLEGKFDALTNAMASFQAQASVQRGIDEAQTNALGLLRTDLTRVMQWMEDHSAGDREAHRKLGIEGGEGKTR